MTTTRLSSAIYEFLKSTESANTHLAIPTTSSTPHPLSAHKSNPAAGLQLEASQLFAGGVPAGSSETPPPFAP